MSSSTYGAPLVRGKEYLEQHEGFVLKGRDNELKSISNILMRKDASSLLLTGESGVGLSAMTLGLQASKESLDTPMDIISKRFYWLDANEMFASGDTTKINGYFENVRATLTRNPDSVLVIESAPDFINAARNSGNPHLINALMADLKAHKYQAILEAPTKGVAAVLECDGNFSEIFTTVEIREPKPADLREILAHSAASIEKHHGITVDPLAIETAVQLTEKYRLTEFRAQPSAAITLLDRALSSYRNNAHRSPPALARIDKDVAAVTAFLSNAQKTGKWEGRTEEELQTTLGTLAEDRKLAEEKWNEQQKTVRLLHNEQRTGEEEIRKLEDEIARIQEEDAAKDADMKAKVEKGELKGEFLASNGFGLGQENPRITELRKTITTYDVAVKEGRVKYDALKEEINADLMLRPEHVLSEFSHISGIPVEKLNENEREKLLNLEENLGKRVMGQPEPVSEVAKAVRRARVGFSMPNKPQGAFMFLGPSGVGKTELAKALNVELNGDEKSLLRFDMSEYMEEHAAAKLIGAPPGYEGYAVGGILTNAVRRNPHSVILFDEIEKAHPRVFDLMLQILDDARLTDSRGLTADFRDTIIIMTTNVGTEFFLNKDIGKQESHDLAMNSLSEKYRPEFLGRFMGNIYCFSRLEEEVLLGIAKKDLKRINGLVAKNGVALNMEDADIMDMIHDHYDPTKGARSILGYIDRNITSAIADSILKHGVTGGTINVFYDPEKKTTELAINDNKQGGPVPVIDRGPQAIHA